MKNRWHTMSTDHEKTAKEHIQMWKIKGIKFNKPWD